MAQSIIKNLDLAEMAVKQLIPVGSTAGMSQATENTAAQHLASPAQVRCIREDGVVKQIEIQCSCGQVIRLACEYD